MAISFLFTLSILSVSSSSEDWWPLEEEEEEEEEEKEEKCTTREQQCTGMWTSLEEPFLMAIERGEKEESSYCSGNLWKRAVKNTQVHRMHLKVRRGSEESAVKISEREEARRINAVEEGKTRINMKCLRETI